MRLLSHLSIRSKLILMLLAVSGISISVTAYIGYHSGQSNLTDRAFSQLTSLRASKAYQIESYFQNIRNHTRSLSQDLMVIAAMQEFESAYRQLETTQIPAKFDQKITDYYRNDFLSRLAQTSDGLPVLESYTPKNSAARYLQYHYLAANPNPVGKKHLLDDPGDGSQYSRVHARYQPIFRKVVETFGYYDMFLIDPEGTVVYTDFKETDFTTNYKTGTYNESNLAKLAAAVRQAKGTDYVKIVDFESYAPSYGEPAAFIAAPIFNKSQFIGVLAFQLPVDEINNVMTGNRNWRSDGLGETGETYLVGRDYLMRSVSRFLVEDPKKYVALLQSIGVNEKTLNHIDKYKTSILEQKVETQGAEQALAGKQGTQIINDYRGIPVLSSYAPLKVDDLDWVILSEMDLAEAYAPIYTFQRQILISATLLMLLVTLVAMWLADLFVKPINILIASVRKVGSGQIDAIAPLESQDEFGELAKSFNTMVRSLRTQTNLVEEKNRENEQLLLSVFPAAIAKRLKRGEKDIAEDVSNVSVLLSELTGFAKLSEAMTAYEIVTTLNDLVTAFDEASERYGMEKIKTIGDSYMAVCGLSMPCLDHDKRAVDFALEMLAIIHRFNHERGFKLNIRLGINSGDVVAGIVGRNKFIYDVWGNTINVASELKATCPPGSVLVSQNVYSRLHDLYDFERAGDLEANGKEKRVAWRLKSTQRSIGSEGLGVP
jgi:class 3 adenylate cyclase